jgi:hypothetical protein
VNLKEIWRKQSWPISRHYPGIDLKEMRKTIETSVRIFGVPAEIRVKKITKDS